MERADTAWTGDYAAGQEIFVPVKNSEGRYVADDARPRPARGRGPGRLPLRRRQPERSLRDIAGITNEDGNVVGLMPHPEHAVEHADRDRPHRRPRLLHLGPEEAGQRVSLDTVERAAKTPDDEQPWAELGPQGGRVRRASARSSAAAPPAPSWPCTRSCGASTARTRAARSTCKQFGDLPQSEALLVGIGENAGVVDVGDGYAVTFKVESHNHPCYVEPYQGAATGVGGIVRDILAMGARPVAVMDPLRFGAPTTPTPSACCPASSRASAATATAWACPTSAARSSSTPATRATRWSTPCASA